MEALHRTRGFTLIEMLVVISIILVLVGLAIPALGAVRGMSYRSQCAVQLKQMGDAIQTYCVDFNGLVPPLAAGKASDNATAMQASLGPGTAKVTTKGSTTAKATGWSLFEPSHLICREDPAPDSVTVTVNSQTLQRPVSYGANTVLMTNGRCYEDFTKPQTQAAIFDGNPLLNTSAIFDARHHKEGMVLFGDWHVDKASALTLELMGLK